MKGCQKADTDQLWRCWIRWICPGPLWCTLTIISLIIWHSLHLLCLSDRLVIYSYQRESQQVLKEIPMASNSGKSLLVARFYNKNNTVFPCVTATMHGFISIQSCRDLNANKTDCDLYHISLHCLMINDMTLLPCMTPAAKTKEENLGGFDEQLNRLMQPWAFHLSSVHVVMWGKKHPWLLSHLYNSL